MVAGILIGVAALVTVAVVFNEPLQRAFNKLTGETQEDIDKREIRDNRGALANTTTFIFGEDALIKGTNELSNKGKVQQATAIGVFSPIAGIILQIQNLFNINKQAQNNALQNQADQTNVSSLDINQKNITVTKLGTAGKKGKSVF